jgi:hypothetical protein
MMPVAWFWVSAVALICGTALLLVSGFVLMRVLGQVLPLLDETRNQVQDLGDLAAGTVGHAAETMDILEMRVSQTMGEVQVSGKAAANQALGVGTALSGIYLAVKLVGAIRTMFQAKHKAAKKSKAWWNLGKRK